MAGTMAEWGGGSLPVHGDMSMAGTIASNDPEAVAGTMGILSAQNTAQEDARRRREWSLCHVRWQVPRLMLLVIMMLT